MISSTNSNPPPGLERLDLDVAVAELAPAAGLLLVAAMRVARLRIVSWYGTRGGLRVTSTPKRDAQPVDDHLDVDLGEPGDDLLAGLRVAVQVDRRVLLLQAAQRR